MATSKHQIWELVKIPAVFTIIAFVLKVLHDLYDSNWNFASVHYVSESPIMVSVILFGWQVINAVHSKRILETMETIPKEVQDRTKQEVNQLKTDNEEFRRQLARGVVEHERHYYRTLTYKRDEGSIYNGFGDAKDLSRNVLFSNKTINLIFREVRDLDRSNVKLLHAIGKKASERFAAEMVKDIQKQSKSSSFDLIQWIKKWIEFDSDAGFGKFDLEGDKAKWKNNMVILLKYSFLTQDCLEDKNNRGLCFFMAGYLEGILNNFPPEVLRPFGLNPGSITIEHDVQSTNECVCAGRSEHNGCRYHIKGVK